MMIYEKIAEAFSKLPEIEAVALSGSATSLIQDESSDYDIYIYYSSPVDKEKRKEILSSFGRCSISCSFFEEGDELVPPDDRSCDLMYRDMEWIKGQIEDVWVKHNARLGYTTCFIFNVKNSRILFDRNGRLAELKAICSSPYPARLKENIIRNNLLIIDGPSEFPYLEQLEVAVKRRDLVSMNHRTAAILASCFDILFALSEELHPGEKKLMQYAEVLKLKKPEGFADDIEAVLKSTADTSALIPNVKRLIEKIRTIAL